MEQGKGKFSLRKLDEQGYELTTEIFKQTFPL
jgi:hypothetical protein